MRKRGEVCVLVRRRRVRGLCMQQEERISPSADAHPQDTANNKKEQRGRCEVGGTFCVVFVLLPACRMLHSGDVARASQSLVHLCGCV